MNNTDDAEADRLALMRADRQPPFTSREALVRMMATSYPAHTLDQSIRRAAARDGRLEWRVGEGRYGYRLLSPAAPVPESRISPVQYVGSADAAACAPAPATGDRDSAGEGGDHES